MLRKQMNLRMLKSVERFLGAFTDILVNVFSDDVRINAVQKDSFVRLHPLVNVHVVNGVYIRNAQLLYDMQIQWLYTFVYYQTLPKIPVYVELFYQNPVMDIATIHLCTEALLITMGELSGILINERDLNADETRIVVDFLGFNGTSNKCYYFGHKGKNFLVVNSVNTDTFFNQQHLLE
jgi:hypothetical protein